MDTTTWTRRRWMNSSNNSQPGNWKESLNEAGISRFELLFHRNACWYHARSLNYATPHWPFCWVSKNKHNSAQRKKSIRSAAILTWCADEERRRSQAKKALSFHFPFLDRASYAHKSSSVDSDTLNHLSCALFSFHFLFYICFLSALISVFPSCARL